MIVLKGISKTYQTKDEDIKALHAVTLALPSRGFASIVGPSGCGKTTLLNILGGLDRPDDGSMTIYQINTGDFKESDWEFYRNQHIGFVFQHYYLMSHLNVFQNLELPLLVGDKTTPKTRISMIKAALMQVGLSDKLFKYPNQLSGGQQQKIAIARALIKHPNILIADEPTGSLDEKASREVLELLKEISKTKLVIVVTHQVELAKLYSDQIIYLKHGQLERIDALTTPLETSSSEDIPFFGRVGMKLSSLFRLTGLNLWMRRFKTLLMALIASIGMVGIGLVIAAAYGFDTYIENQKQETLNSFPIRVDAFALVVPMVNERFQPNMPVLPEVSYAYPRNLQYEFVTTNRLTFSYYEYVNNMDPNLFEHVFNDFRLSPGFVHRYNDQYHHIDLGINELDMSEHYVSLNYDVLAGNMFSSEDFELIIVLDRYQRIGKDLMMTLGFTGDVPVSFDELLNLSIRYVPNDAFYTYTGINYQQISLSAGYLHPDAVDMPVVGIIRLNNAELFDLIKPGLYYRSNTTQAIIARSADSQIVVSQLASNNNVMTNESLNATQKDTFLRRLGYATYPIAYTIIPASFDDKDAIMDYLIGYNQTVGAFDAVEPLDLAGIGLATVRQGLEAITFILLVFALISLVVSNIMIGMMTYHSVLKRIREIGVLRSMGMRKRDVGLLFYLEAVLIGLLASLIALAIIYALLPLLNIFIESATTLPNVAILTLPMVLGILIIHLVLSSIAGWVPAYVASRKDPVVCLRVE